MPSKKVRIVQNTITNNISKTSVLNLKNQEIKPYNQTRHIFSETNRILKTEPIDLGQKNSSLNSKQKVFNYKNCNILFENGEIILLNGSIIYGPKNLNKEEVKNTE